MSPAPGLKENHTITVVAGSNGDTKPWDVKMSGNGPRFTANLANPQREINIIVRKDENGYTVEYSISSEYLLTKDNSTQNSWTMVNGVFTATLGQAFPVLQEGEKKLTIQIDKTKT